MSLPPEGRVNTYWTPPPSPSRSEINGHSGAKGVGRFRFDPPAELIPQAGLQGLANQMFPRSNSVAPRPSTSQGMTYSRGSSVPAIINRPSSSMGNGVNLPFVPPRLQRSSSIINSAESQRAGTDSPPLQIVDVDEDIRREQDRILMPPPPVPSRLSFRGMTPVESPTYTPKRKYEDEFFREMSEDIKPNVRSRTTTPDIRSRTNSPWTIIKREPSTDPDSKVIPILPLPLPSKRFKKSRTSRGTLIPAEQLPVFPLPPLPEIPNPDLVKQVFTHHSLFEKRRGIFEDPDDKPIKHYEKLEHVGDSILGMLVTTWLHETRPRLTCGTATKLKAHLVSNQTLSHLSGLYNFPQRLNGHGDLLPVLRAQTDVRAALVEAYIAALYFSYPPQERITIALPIIDGWLREMFEPMYDFFYNYMKNEYDQHHSAIAAGMNGQVQMLPEEELAKIDNAAMGMAHLVMLYSQRQDRELRYEEKRYETNLGILWEMKCMVDGMELGEAIRADKKTAKNVAAWEAAKKLGLTTDM